MAVQLYLHLMMVPELSSRQHGRVAVEACDPDAIPWPADVKVASSAHGDVYQVPDTRRHVHKLLAARVHKGALATGLTPREVTCFEAVFEAARAETSIIVAQSKGVKERRAIMFAPEEPW